MPVTGTSGNAGMDMISFIFRIDGAATFCSAFKLARTYASCGEIHCARLTPIARPAIMTRVLCVVARIFGIATSLTLGKVASRIIIGNARDLRIGHF